jgi:hypothetical protein
LAKAFCVACRLDVLDKNVLEIGARRPRTMVVFGTVAAADCAELAAPFEDLFKCEDHLARTQRQLDIARRSSPVIGVIGHVEQTKSGDSRTAVDPRP